MNGVCKHFLACAGLSGDEHSRVRRGVAARSLDEAGRDGIGINDILEAVFCSQVVFVCLAADGHFGRLDLLGGAEQDGKILLAVQRHRKNVHDERLFVDPHDAVRLLLEREDFRK